jgi:hypothetical protein
VREALVEPAKPKIIEEFDRRIQRLTKQPGKWPGATRRFKEEERADGYINDFHRERSERLMADLAKKQKAL